MLSLNLSCGQEDGLNYLIQELSLEPSTLRWAKQVTREKGAACTTSRPLQTTGPSCID